MYLDVDPLLRALQQVLWRRWRAGHVRLRLGGGEEADHDPVQQHL